MSRKPAKKQANIISMPELSDEELIADLEQQLEKMKADQEEKLTSGIKNFFDMIGTTADKYRTVTGMVVVLQDCNSILGSHTSMLMPADDFVSFACKIANEIANGLTAVSEIEHIDKVEELINIVDGLYNHEFTKDGQVGYSSMWHLDKALLEMQYIKVCQQLGPIADSLVEFKERTDEEIEKTEQKLAELKGKQTD